LCGSTAATIRSLLHPDVLVTSGGGGVGNATGLAELALVKTMAECKDMDVIALHSYDSSGSTSAEALDLQLTAYRCKPWHTEQRSNTILWKRRVYQDTLGPASNMT
jgi:hypothetical protein